MLGCCSHVVLLNHPPRTLPQVDVEQYFISKGWLYPNYNKMYWIGLQVRTGSGLRGPLARNAGNQLGVPTCADGLQLHCSARCLPCSCADPAGPDLGRTQVPVAGALAAAAVGLYLHALGQGQPAEPGRAQQPVEGRVLCRGQQQPDVPGRRNAGVGLV